jgi:uroporphyrinogen-III synthase
VKPPLANLRVVVTRGAHQAGGLAAALAEAGARVELLPLLEIAPPRDPRALERAASELPLYDWLVLTSANAVEAFFALAGGPLPRRLQVAAVGPATARALRGEGVEANLIAAAASAQGLVAALAPRLGRQQRVLLPQAADAGPELASGLTAAGAEVVAVAAYEKRLPASAPAIAERLFRREPIGWVTFASGSAARNFAFLFGDRWPERRPELHAAAIGPVTAGALRALGVEPAAEAVEPSDRELAKAIVKEAAQTVA